MYSKIILIASLLFATPALAGNRVCTEAIDDWKTLKRISQLTDCDVVYILISTKIEEGVAVSQVCDYSKQVLKHGKTSNYVSYTCVPAK